jgi:2-polyprenyl-3-methyl-5-hydroxy-6-metoxy-1,4-benzoquinol methylase
MHCYLCHSNNFSERKGEVRDAPLIKILECNQCGLVSLDSTSHIQSGFYENSGMHGDEPKPIEEWLKETHWDDERRFEQLKTFLPNKCILDFGCGAGGFLAIAKNLAANAVGVELERRVQVYWRDSEITVLPTIDGAAGASTGGYDLITAFHVIEHLPDPCVILKQLGLMLKPDGRMVIEVPSANDALLTLYDCEAFQRFTYWSQHLHLFTAATLNTLIEKAGLKMISVQHHQRYPLSNHLYWLSQGKPGGHRKWSFLNWEEVSHAYAQLLASIGRTDTLIAHIERYNTGF